MRTIDARRTDITRRSSFVSRYIGTAKVSNLIIILFSSDSCQRLGPSAEAEVDEVDVDEEVAREDSSLSGSSS